MEQKFSVYKRTTDVQQTWKQYGWVPPSEDPKIRAKWTFYKTLNTETDTERAFDVYLPQEEQHG